MWWGEKLENGLEQVHENGRKKRQHPYGSTNQLENDDQISNDWDSVKNDTGYDNQMILDENHSIGAFRK